MKETSIKSKSKKRISVIIIISIAIIVISLFLGLAILAVGVINKNKPNNGITRAEAAKMIAGACISDTSSLIEGSNWYDKYVTYVNNNGYMDIRKPKENVTYLDLTTFVTALGMTTEELGIQIQKDDYEIKKNDFVNIYIDLIAKMDIKGTVRTINAGIYGTKSNIAEAGEWEAYTTLGVYNYEGLELDSAIDKMTSLIINGESVLCVQRILDESFAYENAWVEEGSKNTLKVQAYGAYREFKISELPQAVSESIADITIEDKKVTKVDVKKDMINAKVLSITNEYVELEGKGKIQFEETYKIYNNCNGFTFGNYKDVVVGYSLQDFAIENGKICGAVIVRSLVADNIRVLIKTTDFESIFHNSVEITSDSDFTLYYGTNQEKHNAHEIVKIVKSSPCLVDGRVQVKAEVGGSISINSIKRNQGIPSYEGTIELSVSDTGLLVTNEVLIENYLKRVVPSEMYVNYGLEALKVQAVCARSYAYRQLNNNSYLKYGAHVDDSTQYQVYNNVNEMVISNQSVADTSGEVITYDGKAIEAFYYSTSCGYTTDVSLWGTNTAEYPYYTAHCVNQNASTWDLSDENTFRAFINNTDYRDFDKDAQLYRWRWEVTIDQISNSFNSKLADRYKMYPENILTLSKESTYESKSITSIGVIKDITVEKRIAGGAITCLIVTGSEATVRIDGENNIRHLMGVSEKPLTTTTGNLMSMASLPSTFCIFDPVMVKNEVAGYIIIGGGYGHGIGMSQNAVYSMTNRNWNYIDIIKYFYIGTEVTKVY